MPFLRHCSLVISPHWADPTISPRVGDFPSLRFCADCSGVCPSASNQKCHVQTSSNSPNSILLLVNKMFFFIEIPSFVGSYLGQLPQKVVPRFASLLGDEWGHHIDKCKLSRRFAFLVILIMLIIIPHVFHIFQYTISIIIQGCWLNHVKPT